MKEVTAIRVYAGSIQARLGGPYIADFSFHRRDGGDIRDSVLRLEVEADDLPGIADAAARAYSQIQRRRIVDAVCGDHPVCENSRMVYVTARGRKDKVLEHCPRCAPLIEAAMEKGVLPR